MILPECIHISKVVPGTTADPKALTATTKTGSKGDLNLWHHHLGHINTKLVLEMARKGMVKGMSVVKNTSTQKIYEPCLHGKQTRIPIPKVTESRETTLLA